MKKRNSPILIITIILVLGAGLFMVRSQMDAADKHGHEPEQAQGPETGAPPTVPTVSPDDLVKDIEKTSKPAPTQPQPTAPVRVEVEDRYDQGSGNWWNKKASNPKGG